MTDYFTISTYSFKVHRAVLQLVVGMVCLLFMLLPSVTMEELMNPDETGKFLLFLVDLLAIVSVMAVWLMATKNLAISICAFDVALFVLLAYITANRFLVQQTYGFSLKYYELLGLSVLYIVLRNIQTGAFLYVLLALVTGGILQALCGAFQLWGYLPSHSAFEMTGNFSNPGPYAGFLASIFPVALGIYLFRKQFKRHPSINAMLFEYLPLAGILSVMLVLPASRSRAAWLSVVLSAAFLLSHRYHLLSRIRIILDKTWKKVLVSALLVLSVGAGGYQLYHFKPGSADGRRLIWKVTGNMIAGSPWTGVGYDRFKAHYMQNQAQYFAMQADGGETWLAGDNYYAFNEVLAFLAEQGFVGLTLLAGLAIWIVRSAIKPNINYFSVIALSGLLSIVTFGMFSYPGEILPIKVCMVLYLAILVAEKKPLRRLSLFSKPILRIAIALVVLCQVGFAANAAVEIRQAYGHWQEAINRYQSGLYRPSVDQYEKLYPFLKFNGEYLMNYGKALSMLKRDKEAVQVLKEARDYYSSTIIETASGDSFGRLKQYDKAEANYRNASDMIPSRLYPRYLLAKLYHKSGDHEAAIREAKTILGMEIKVHSNATDEIKLEMRSMIIAYKQSDFF